MIFHNSRARLLISHHAEHEQLKNMIDSSTPIIICGRKWFVVKIVIERGVGGYAEIAKEMDPLHVAQMEAGEKVSI